MSEDTTEPHDENEENQTKIEKIKAHIGRHKVVYSIGTGVVIAGVGYYIGVRVGSSKALSLTASIVGDNNKLDQRVIHLAERSGPPSWEILCRETGEKLNSQRAMAHAHRISEVDLSQHLNGFLDDVKGRHYVRTGLSA